MERQKLWVSAIFSFLVGDAIALQTRGPLPANLRSAFDVSQGLLGLVAPAGTLLSSPSSSSGLLQVRSISIGV